MTLKIRTVYDEENCYNPFTVITVDGSLYGTVKERVEALVEALGASIEIEEFDSIAEIAIEQYRADHDEVVRSILELLKGDES